jgi:pimeloyl-ACP methyl ester carboxylesterase
LDIPSLSRLAASVLDHFNVSRADVLGYSYGGAIAQQLAHDHPERVKKLVLAATHCGKGCIPGTPEAVKGMLTPQRFYSSTFFESTAGACFGGVTARDQAMRSRIFATRCVDPPTAYGYAMQWMGISGWSSRPFLDKIPHETLVINGNDDPLVPPANARLLVEGIPNATLEIIDRAGHLFLMDDAENLAARVGRFLNGSGTLHPTSMNPTSTTTVTASPAGAASRSSILVPGSRSSRTARAIWMACFAPIGKSRIS